jgi:hypothetical protein
MLAENKAQSTAVFGMFGVAGVLSIESVSVDD